MVLDPPELRLPTLEGNEPAFYKFLQKHHPDEAIDLPMLEEGYPKNYPDLPQSRWMYNIHCHAMQKSITQEYDAMPPCMPLPMDLDPQLTLPTAEWLHDWEPYVNTQVPTPTITGL
jgi:hypothetical protein